MRVLPFQVVIDAINHLRKDIEIMSDTLAAEIQSLTENVAKLTDERASVEAALKGLHDQYDALAAKLENAGVDAAQLQALHDLNAQLAANTAGLAAAVVANTPASTTPSTDQQPPGPTGAAPVVEPPPAGATGDTGPAPTS